MSGELRKVMCTIVSANYLARARVLMQSFRETHPGWDLEVLVVDEIGDHFDPELEDFGVTELRELPIRSPRRFFFRYSVIELNTAAKAPFLKWLFQKRGYDRVLYLDPDIEVYSTLHEVDEAFDEGALMCLVPHLTGINDDNKKPTELEILAAGTYNLGFIALARHPQLMQFLDWWWQKMEFDCVVDFEAGLFVDQKWIDLVPGIFDDVRIIRNEGYDVAYWNLGHRRVHRRNDGSYQVNDDRLVFFHFSGLDPLAPKSFSKHQDRFELEDLGDERGLVDAYCNAVKAAGHRECCNWSYAYDRFDDGSPIIEELRALYRSDSRIQSDAGEDPFALGHRYFNQSYDSAIRQPLISHVLYHLWSKRADLRQYYPDPLTTHRSALANWFVASASTEHAIPDCYVEPVRASIRRFDQNAGRRLRLRVALRRVVYFLSPLGRHLSPRIKARIRALLMPSIPQKAGVPSGSGVTQQHIRVLDVTGFHPSDAFDMNAGEAWMSRRAEIGLQRGQGSVLRIEGRHHASDIERATGSPELVLSIGVDGLEVGEIVLKKAGTFSESIDIGDELPENCRISIEANKVFIPKEMGTGDDPRELSVRISAIAVGDLRPIEFSNRERPFMGPAHRRGAETGVNIVGYLRAELGIGESARLCAAAASAANLPASLIDFQGGCTSRTNDDRWSGLFSTVNRHPVNVIHINADQLPRAYAHFGKSFFDDRYNIGVWHWELPVFPDEWAQSFSLLQEIWAPTRFIQESVSEKSPLPVVLMPHAIQFDRPQDARRDQFGLPADDFLFLMMYDMHSFQVRKNPEAVIDAFLQAFTAPSGVGLVIKVMNAAHSPQAFADLRRRVADLPGAFLIAETLTRSDVYRLESVCDCFVSLHRSEGFGLGLAECMYLGKPVIGTNWSGNVDFMDEHNSCPIRYSLVELEEDFGPYKRGQIWAEPDHEHAAEQMVRLVGDAPFRERIAAAGRRTIASDHSPRVIGERYRRRLEIVSQVGF